MPQDAEAPLILTLAVCQVDFLYFDQLRQRHFPPDRNFIPAHLTLFHKLPGAELPTLAATAAQAAREQAPFSLDVVALWNLGRGVAFRIEAPALRALRDRLARRWQAWLGAQDRQGFHPHVTIQNKVSPETARTLYEGLSATFEPFKVRADGLILWRYLGGPWQEVVRLCFRSS